MSQNTHDVISQQHPSSTHLLLGMRESIALLNPPTLSLYSYVMDTTFADMRKQATLSGREGCEDETHSIYNDADNRSLCRPERYNSTLDHYGKRNR